MGLAARRTSAAYRLPAVAAVLALLIPILGAAQVPCTTDGNCNGFGGGCEVRRCINGFCGPLEPRNCNDGDPCTVDGCNDFGGFCTHEPFCLDNGLICDGSDECFVISVNGTPVPLCDDTPPSCDDADACTADFCNDPIGCQHVPKSCADGNACTTDVCDVVLGCSNLPIADCCRTGSECGDACTESACVENTCTAGTPRRCDDGDPCTADACDAATGCVHTRVPGCCGADADCGDPCAGHACTGGTCAQGAPPSCDDGDACTTDTCIGGAGCVATGRTGFDALACVCERVLPAPCATEPLPKKVAKARKKACKLIGRAAATAEGGQRRKLATRAGTQLGRARTRAERSDVAEACRTPLVALLGDDQRRAELVGAGP